MYVNLPKNKPTTSIQLIIFQTKGLTNLLYQMYKS